MAEEIKTHRPPPDPNSAKYMPQPDFLLCCSNICNCMIKWYENLSRELNIPMIMIDVPFNPDYDVSDAELEYVKAQWAAIHQLEELKEVGMTSTASCLRVSPAGPTSAPPAPA